jgi:hypothetical protein
MSAFAQVPDPLKPPEVIVVNKEVAARGQLHTAIAIWFEYGDPVSIQRRRQILL